MERRTGLIGRTRGEKVEEVAAVKMESGMKVGKSERRETRKGWKTEEGGGRRWQ